MDNYSVLMAVYHKEKPAWFREAILSAWNQTVRPSDFVLVCDGPLNEGLDAVIEEMHNEMGDVMQVVRLEKNGGLGNALNVGIGYCKNELVARMDSDDVALKDRCEKQLAVFAADPEVSIVSGVVDEFIETPGVVDARRVPPETHEQIMEFVRKRCPFNHPCVMYRKSAVAAAGGYQEFYLLEDYYLWIRMLLNGAKGYNLQETLLWMRAGENMYQRRGGKRYVKSQKQLFNYMRERGLITRWQCFKSVTVRTLSGLAPNKLRKFMFEKMLRTK